VGFTLYLLPGFNWFVTIDEVMGNTKFERQRFDHLDPFGGAWLCPLGQCVKRCSGSPLPAPACGWQGRQAEQAPALYWGAEGLTLIFGI